ncbi:hypothetical protein LCGC14_0322820 [marine sediment metagenome]|uniref:Uncharacterized protein n=1 Tax=marine sediment metagenome TaxID=412755 RepID=A0A0F9WQP6_9ZZZZ
MAHVRVEFKFPLLSQVKIKATGAVGKVIGLFIDRDSITFALVEWFDKTAQQHRTYFREEDLESVG